MHEFSNAVGLLGSSLDEELQYEPRETTVQKNSSNPEELGSLNSTAASTNAFL